MVTVEAAESGKFEFRGPMMVNTGSRSLEDMKPLGEVLTGGYAKGNELYNYQELPPVSIDELEGLQGKSLSEISYFMAKRLMGDTLPDDELKRIMDEAYSLENFELDDEDRNIRFTRLGDDIMSREVLLADLSGGLTGSFKDMAMVPLALIMDSLSAEAQRELLIFLITSGDTGVAGFSAFSENVKGSIVGLIPDKDTGVAPFQWADMARYHSPDNGVHVLQTDKDFSDLNELHMLMDQAYDLSAVNSVNPGRLILQTAYQASLYLKAAAMSETKVGDPIDITIQAGNAGNGISAIWARKMGIPWGDIILPTTTDRDTLYHVIEHDTLWRQKGKPTDSSAMDVDNPSNMWRWFGSMYGNDPEKNQAIYDAYMKSGKANIKDISIEDYDMRRNLMSERISTFDRDVITRRVFSATNGRVIIDPHTANGLAAIEILIGKGRLTKGRPMVAVETARPYKFDGTTQRRIGYVAGRPVRYVDLEGSQENSELPFIAGAADLGRYMDEHTNAPKKS